MSAIAQAKGVETTMTQMPDRSRPPILIHTGTGYRTDVEIRDHHILADEPVDKGGTDTGPTPTELMTAALAACTSVTIRMYADRKGWPIGDIDIRIWHRRVDEKDPADPDARARRIDLFDVEIEIEGPLDDEQRERLLYIAGRCPVKRALEGSSRITTSIVD